MPSTSFTFRCVSCSADLPSALLMGTGEYYGGLFRQVGLVPTVIERDAHAVLFRLGQWGSFWRNPKWRSTMTEARTTTFDTVSDRCKDGGRFGDASAVGASPWSRSRVDMEDAHATVLKLDDQRWSRWSYFGIFDGHAGFRTASKASEKLHSRIVTSLNTLIADPKSTSQITSSQLDFHKLEMAIKDAYFKFDNDWRDENRTSNPGTSETVVCSQKPRTRFR